MHQAQYGHAQVPIGFEDNVQLANWTSTQRQEYKNLLKGKPSRLSDQRIKLLNGIGFAWELQRGGRKRRVTITRDGDYEDVNAAKDGTHMTVGKRSKRDADMKDNVMELPMKSQPFSTALVLPGVALMGGNQDAQRVEASSSTTPTAALLTIPTASASIRSTSGTNTDACVRSGEGRFGPAEGQQTESEPVARTEPAGSGTQTSYVATAAFPSTVGGTNAPGANDTVQAQPLATPLDTVMLQAQLMSRSHLSGPTGLMQALVGAPLAVNANLAASALSTYQQALLLTARGAGLSRNPLLGQNLGAPGSALLSHAANLPLHSLLQAQGNSHNNILQNLRVIPGQQQHSLAGASYSPSLLLQTANLLLLQQRLQQVSSAPAIAASLASQQLNRNHQQQEASTGAEREYLAETKSDDHTVHRSRANWPGSHQE
jgi:Helicase associated domain